MQKALYRKYRSRTFDEVYGQEHITSVLKYECAVGNISHAYLFCGSRGTGKTSCAKILSKAANCLDPIDGNPCGVCDACRAIDGGYATDVLEMDAASNNGVDNIRDLRDEVVFAPSTLKYRVYIIDEVHMLSPSAFNALLKTLEEPPEHCIFILATTELHKLPPTIISRCQRFDFRRISIDNISRRLFYIAEHEGFTIDENAAFAIAKFSSGGMRDAISLFELCASTNKNITLDVVESVIGSSGRDTVEELIAAICQKDYEKIFSIIHSTVMGSRELDVLWHELMDYYRDMLVFKYAPDPAKYLDLTDAQTKTLSKNASLFTKADLLFQSSLLEEASLEMLKAPSSKRTVAELTLIRICDPGLDTSKEALLKRIELLETKLSELSYSGMRPIESEPKENAPTVESKKENSAKKPEAPTSDADLPAKKEQVKKPSAPSRFRQTAELAEKFKAEKDFMIASFIEQCKITRESDDSFVFTVSNNFILSRINDNREKIARQLSSLVASPISKEQLKVIVGDTSAEDPFDEI